MYKLLATDLDGTLLPSGFTISEGNLTALRRAREDGVYVAICSGRSYMSLDNFVKQLDLTGEKNYGICYNGGMVYETTTKEVIYEDRLNSHLALGIIGHLKSFPNRRFDILCYSDGNLISDTPTEMIEYYSKLSMLPVHYMSFEDISCDVSKILMLGDNADLLPLRSSLDAYSDKIEMVFSSPYLFEIMPKNVDKGKALLKLADYLGIDKTEVIAVGDNYNDIEMITEAGLGIAVANAVDDLKAAADYVLTKTSSEDALKEVVERFLKG